MLKCDNKLTGSYRYKVS